MDIKRRNFLKTASGLTAGLAASVGLNRQVQAADQPTQSEASEASKATILTATPDSTRNGDMLYRTLGRTKEKVSLIGLGGSRTNYLRPATTLTVRLLPSRYKITDLILGVLGVLAVR